VANEFGQMKGVTGRGRTNRSRSRTDTTGALASNIKGGTTMRRQFLAGATVLGMLCASGGLSAALTAGTASAATSSTPIIVGGDGDLAINAGVGPGFVAGIYRFNKAGGLDGRKIEFTGFLDDGFSPATNLTNAQELVENKHVMVVAPFLSEVSTASTGDFLAGAKTPFIGWAVNGTFVAQPKWGYGINGDQENPIEQNGTVGQILVATHNVKTPGKVKIAYIAENVAGGITSNQALAGTAKYAGMKVVYQKAPIAVIGTTNYAPYAQAIIASGANVAFETLDTGDATGLAAALKAAGFKGPIFNGVTYLPGSLGQSKSEEAALDGVYVVNEFPADENNTPAIKQAEKDLTATGQPPYLTSGVSIGYWSAIVLEQMLRATLKSVGGDPNKVTGATIAKTVNAGFTYTDPIPGGIGSEYFPADETTPTGCGTLLQTEGAGFKQIIPYECLGAINVVKDKKVDVKTGKIIP
jgi:ABC-type branched-subunit amino acid transport system substrate-binding protein